jgi:hypothetical protein
MRQFTSSGLPENTQKELYMSDAHAISNTPLFQLGRLVATPGAMDLLARAEQPAFEFLARHQHGDWGDVCKDDAEENEFSLKHGYRLLSVYRANTGEALWVITEADRSATTLLLPSEY